MRFSSREPERLQRGREAAGARLQLAVGQRSFGIDECDLVAQAARHIGIDEIADGVVRPALQEVFKHARYASPAGSIRDTSRRSSPHRPLMVAAWSVAQCGSRGSSGYDRQLGQHYSARRFPVMEQYRETLRIRRRLAAPRHAGHAAKLASIIPGTARRLGRAPPESARPELARAASSARRRAPRAHRAPPAISPGCRRRR